ncbi:hypothetical protein DPMN_051516 [Dreissena polymorpha]|uniref:Uncharacterized protein n=1 Tax=Dreissena polymorpha TaxID=45954 RepID=A0A9D4HM74_DREPO|nr:hypothetical protein DPMN_051516 [Dreissena polymorpha]
MTCFTCIEFYGTKSIGSGLKGCNTFLTGSTNLKKSAVSDHELSKAHIDATANTAAKCSDSAAIASSQAGKAMLSLHLSERQRLMHLFRNAHAVGKKGRPITDYTWLCNVTEANGVDLG